MIELVMEVDEAAPTKYPSEKHSPHHEPPPGDRPEKDKPEPEPDKEDKPDNDNDPDKEEGASRTAPFPLSLADAIRWGSRNTRQCFDSWVEYNQPAPDESPVMTCALGAALIAIHADEFYSGVIKEHWPWILERGVCPAGYCEPTVSATVMDLVVHLNDEHRWTRERIADWIEQIEPRPIGDTR